MFGRKKQQPQKADYDPSRQYPAMRCSICTGEQVAGLKDRETGDFHELMLIRGDEDLASFRSMLNLAETDEIKKFY
jgi:hypothetical protein